MYAKAQVANLWNPVSVFLHFWHVSVDCRFILLARSYIGTVSCTTLYQVDRTVSHTTPPQLSLMQNIACFVYVHIFVLHKEDVWES